MGHRTVYSRKYLSQLGLAEYIRPYLLRNLDVKIANQVWSIDITYIPMPKGFMYCTRIIDVYSRKILSWGSPTAWKCNAVWMSLKRMFANTEEPEIINSDQGAQFTSHKWIHAVESKQTKVSMDGKGRATDNRWINVFGEYSNTTIFISTQPKMAWNYTRISGFTFTITIPTRNIKQPIESPMNYSRNQLEYNIKY